MSRQELSRYLRRAALDRAFRELATRDPLASFEGFDLDTEAREVLMRGGAEVLGLVAVAMEAPEPAHPEPRPTRPVVVPHHHHLPEVDLFLRVVPHPTEERLRHGATLHGEMPPHDGAARFRIRLSPTAHPLPDGPTALIYSAAIEPVVEPDATPDAFHNPRAGTQAARDAADAVLSASSEDRFDRVLDLVAVLAP